MNLTNAPDELLALAEVAEEFKIPPSTLRYWRHTDQGPESFTRGKRVFYRRSKVEAWLQVQEVSSSRGGVA